ncbi:MAG: hypothetical protein K0U86_00680 [Planctomycetes bacterium]|nr:hypothetical protein [Planctomycetota bacterium]MCH9723402.1 hypothetical protein [Planctomycetota bacterium]MCH9777285.1 hypothetical protein [Planctomycetota bacterium]MCH9793005.1 hypothetical protein [Planctomycetota bacterium]
MAICSKILINQLVSDLEDGYLDVLNPLDSFWSIPDIGAQFGNEDDYAAGHTIGANPGPGFQIVTGTFQHEAAKTLDLSVEGESKPIGTTPNHPHLERRPPSIRLYF